MRRMAGIIAGAACLLSTAAIAQDPAPIDLPSPRAFPESLSISADGTAYVGSLSGGISRVDLSSGQVAPFIAPGAYGSGSIFGVLADTVNGMVWACSSNLSGAGLAIAGADAGSVLKGFDLATGEGKVSLALPGERPMCNDIAVAADGAVYVTDTTSSHILRWRPGEAALELWLADPALAREGGASGLDGLAFGGDGNLYVNNFQSNMLARVTVQPDGTAGGVTILNTARAFAAPDGLRPLGGLRFVQAEGAGRVAILTVSGDDVAVETLVEGLSSATGADVRDGTIWYVQGEVGYVFNPSLRDKSPPLPFRVTPIAIPHQHHH